MAVVVDGCVRSESIRRRDITINLTRISARLAIWSHYDLKEALSDSVKTGWRLYKTHIAIKKNKGIIAQRL